MKILHTSDWHLGSSLHGKKRLEENRAFLSWLIETIDKEKIDLLLIAGDIFDSSAPGSIVQRMYYEFLGQVTKTCCSSVIVTAGNHDSPSLLSAPKEILGFLNIHVLGTIPEDPIDQIIPVCEKDGTCRLIVCAVPFLREKDIRLANPAQSQESSVPLLTRGIIDHYARTADRAMGLRLKFGINTPIIATGHLFAAGCETRTGDGIRECYVGSSVLVGADAFPPCFSYVALGHLHIPQTVSRNDHIRYSGSPIPIGFSEAEQAKEVVFIEISDSETIQIRGHQVPVFHKLASLKGTQEEIEDQIRELVFLGKKAWIEVLVDSIESPSALESWITGLTEGTVVEVLKICTMQTSRSCMMPETDGESLENLSEREVFKRRLLEENLPEEENEELIRAFDEILIAYQQKDHLENE